MRSKQKNCTMQECFLRRQKVIKIQIRVLQFFILAVFLGLWELSSDLDWIDAFIFSSPSRVAKTFLEMWKGQELYLHIAITLYETLVSFFLVMGISILFSVILWLFPKVSAVAEPYLVVLNSLPKSALAPLLIVWLGANVRTIIVAGISVAVFGSVISIYSAFSEVDSDMMKLIYTLGGTKKDILIKVVLPWSVPSLLAAFKVNIGLCLVGVVIGEFIGARRGLGYLIIYGSQVFR